MRMTYDSAPPSASKPPVQKRPVCHPQKRSAESCRAGNSYIREKFHPAPTRMFVCTVRATFCVLVAHLLFTVGDVEKEKRRLQSIMATGEEPRAAVSKKAAACQNPDVSEETDRYQEGKTTFPISSGFVLCSSDMYSACVFLQFWMKSRKEDSF